MYLHAYTYIYYINVFICIYIYIYYILYIIYRYNIYSQANGVVFSRELNFHQLIEMIISKVNKDIGT